MKTCETCLAFNEPDSECRRKAPVMVPVPAQGLMPGQVGFVSLGMYPATKKDKWCAEHLEGRIPGSQREAPSNPSPVIIGR